MAHPNNIQHFENHLPQLAAGVYVPQTAITLILLPGMDGTGEMFQPLLQALPADIKTIVVSYPTTEVMDYAALVELASAYIPKSAPYILLGESFSGPVAIQLAANAGTQLKGLILSGSFARNPRPMLSKLSFLVPTIAINQFWLPMVSRLVMGGFNNQRIYTMLGKAFSMVSPIVLRARLNEAIKVDFSDKLANIKVPILYLRARHDRLVPASASRLILNLAKNVALVELDAPHLLLQIAAQEAATRINQFIEKNQKFNV